MSSWPSGSILPPEQQIQIVVNGQPFNVWDCYRTEVVSQKYTEQGVDWTMLCDWKQRYAIANAMIGGGAITGDTTFFYNGWPYPDNPNWLAQKISMGPDQPQGQALQQTDAPFLSQFQRAKMVVHFGVPPFTSNQNNVGEDELDFCSNSTPQTGTTTAFTFVGGGGGDVPGDMNLPITYTTIKYTKTVYNRSGLNLPLIRSLVNHINSSPFLGAPNGTVLFQGGKSRRKITAAGALNWDITFQFEDNSSILGGTQAGWNKLWKAGVGWTPFVIKTLGTNLFPDGDLNQLLLP